MTNQQASSEPRVSYAESAEVLGRRVGVYIVQRFPKISLDSAFKRGPAETNCYTLLGPPVRRFVWLKRPMIGSLDKNQKQWLLTVFGRKNVDQMKQLAEALSREFNVSIHVRLGSEDEDFRWDVDLSG